MKPIAAPMIGGMLSSAVHVLIMTPVLFVLMKTRDLKKGRLKHSAININTAQCPIAPGRVIFNRVNI